jgi:DNA-binding MarR family transcriptional regulator
MKTAQKQGPAGHDHVDRVYERWAEEMPEVSTRGAQVLARARRITTYVRPAIEGVFKTFELDGGEFDVLATLRRSGAPFALRPTELYRSMMISSGGLTDRLDRLTASGLIRRRPSTEDARSLLVELTAAGRKRIEAAFAADMAIEDKLVAGLTREEHAQLVQLLRKVMVQLEAGAET